MQSRKFIIAVAVLVAATVLVALGQLPVEQWVTMVEMIMVVYVTGNIAEKVIK